MIRQIQHAISALYSLHMLCTSNPIQSNPIQSNPIQSNPIQSHPIPSHPIPPHFPIVCFVSFCFCFFASCPFNTFLLDLLLHLAVKRGRYTTPQQRQQSTNNVERIKYNNVVKGKSSFYLRIACH